MKVNGKKGHIAHNKGSLLRQGFDVIEDVKTELKRVTWTSKEELQVYTKIVVGATFTVGMLVYTTDIVIKTALETINFVLRAFGG